MRKNYYPFLFLLVVVLSTGMFSGPCKASDNDRQQVLKIYNWADYIDEDLLTEFPEWFTRYSTWPK